MENSGAESQPGEEFRTDPIDPQVFFKNFTSYFAGILRFCEVFRLIKISLFECFALDSENFQLVSRFFAI